MGWRFSPRYGLLFNVKPAQQSKAPHRRSSRLTFTATEIRIKPSVILYKTLPTTCSNVWRKKHFTVTQVKNLSPDTVQQHAEAFAQGGRSAGVERKVDAALLEKMPGLRATSTISVGYDNFDVEALNARKVLC